MCCDQVRYVLMLHACINSCKRHFECLHDVLTIDQGRYTVVLHTYTKILECAKIKELNLDEKGDPLASIHGNGQYC